MDMQRDNVLTAEEELLSGVQVLEVTVGVKVVEEFSAPLDDIEILGVDDCGPDMPSSPDLVNNLEAAFWLLLYLPQCLGVEKALEKG